MKVNKRRMKHILNKILAIFIVAVFSLGINSNIVKASASCEKDLSKSPEELAKMLIGDNIDISDAKSSGTVYQLSGLKDTLGINKVLVFDTSGQGGANVPNDPDLEKVITADGKSYGGHTSSLEFTMTATGTLLNFNYAFASCEFDQGSTYNDIFGLFVSVNGGEYENIAYLDNGKPITITNLRAGRDGTQLESGASTSIVSGTEYDYFKAATINEVDSAINGYTYLYNAKKQVNIGDKVSVKFVIADVGDTGVDSYVFLEQGSLSFTPESNIDYGRECIKQLEAGAKYEITLDGVVYTFIADEDGYIPLAGTDINGKEYDFMGKKLLLVQKGATAEEDSQPQEISVAARPGAPGDLTGPSDIVNNKPAEVKEGDIVVTKDSITIIHPVEGQEYSADGGKTWKKIDENGQVVFQGLTEAKILTRIAATKDAPASMPSSGIDVELKEMLDNISETVIKPYEGIYDGASHSATITSVEGAKILYSSTENGEYSEEPLVFTEPGIYNVYYRITKDGYYPAYGCTKVKILIQTEKPQAKIDIVNREITGLVDKYTYKINGIEVKPKNGKVEIPEECYGKEITIISEGEGEEYLPSEAQTISIPSKQPKVDISVEAINGDNSNNGQIVGLSSELTYEYRCNGGKWVTVSGVDSIKNLKSGTYEIRIKAKTDSESEICSGDIYTVVISNPSPKPTPEPTYSVTVNNGLGSGSYKKGDTVTITAESAPEGKEFDSWSVVSGGVVLVDSTSSITTFVMPASNVELKAIYKDIIIPEPTPDPSPEPTPDPSPKPTPDKPDSGDGSDLGEIKNDTNPDNNEYSANLDNSSSELKDKLLTPEEKDRISNGENVRVYLEVVDIKDKVSETDKTLINKNIDSSIQIGTYLDLSLFKQVGADDPKKIANTNGSVTISFKVPENLINNSSSINRTYKIVRVHEGVVSILDATFDPETGNIIFETDAFSTYALVYTDNVKADVKDDNKNTNKDSNTGTPIATVVSDNKTTLESNTQSNKSNGIKTGDTNEIGSLYAICGISMMVMLVYVYRRKLNTNK